MNVGKGSHPNMVKVFGPGVERTGLKANEPTHFTVDCSGAGDGKKDIDAHIHLTLYQRHLFAMMAVSIRARTKSCIIEHVYTHNKTNKNFPVSHVDTF